MAAVPWFEVKKRVVHAPHVVILGAGASKAACPNGDARGRVVPVMAELVDSMNLSEPLRSVGIDPASDFETLYDRLVSSSTHQALVTEIERRVLEYFEGLSLPDEVTLYDHLLLSLREKDFVATFNWDPFLIQAYLRNRSVARLPRVAFLHGNVRAAACVKDQVKGIYGDLCQRCGNPLERAKLLYPVRQKNYTDDPYIANEWSELKYFLEEGYLLTIIGYAAPSTDVEAVTLMRQIWTANPRFELAQVNVVDTKSSEELERTWNPFLCRTHYGFHKMIRNTWLFRFPRRSCEGLAMATLQNRPWHDNPFPNVGSLDELHAWLKPLLAEEEVGEFSGEPSPGLPRTS